MAQERREGTNRPTKIDCHVPARITFGRAWRIPQNGTTLWRKFWRFRHCHAGPCFDLGSENQQAEKSVELGNASADRPIRRISRFHVVPVFPRRKALYRS